MNAIRGAEAIAILTQKDLDLKVQEYKNSLKTNAELLIFKDFPETIVKLSDILETPQFLDQKFIDVSQDLNIPIPDSIVIDSRIGLPPAKKSKLNKSINQGGIKVMILPCGAVSTVSSNKNVLDFIDIIKPHIEKLVKDSKLIKMWISFMIPKIEDGNNFGVEIQADILSEVENVEMEVIAFHDLIFRYFIERGKLASKVVKYPQIEDYRRAVQEVDEKEYFSLLLAMVEIRNCYCILHDILVKNFDKITKPRSNNAAELHYF